jgi:DNA-binding NtrC family response regulator
LRNALAGKALAGELQRIKRSRDGTLTFSDVITRAPRMKTTLANAEKAAGSDIPVLIEGESGVGKELIARAIHGTGARRARPFVAVNCGALPENLVESILFGHEKGAFTGATERHTGKFIEADGGTLFLDEIGELPLAAQVKLLRALQEGEVEPVGAKRPVKVATRIISATNRDLIADVKAGRFREDLFYRLHVFPIAVPPLRERTEDIPELARHFAARFAAEEGKRITAISTEALALLSQYRWPGNVRQIENAVFRAVVLADGETIGINEFPHIAAQLGDDRGLPIMGASAAAQSLTALVPGDTLPVETPALTFPTSTLKLTGADGHVRALDEIERDVIRYAISHYRGQMSEVARRLKFGRSTLYRKLEGLGLRDEHDENVESGDERWAD